MITSIPSSYQPKNSPFFSLSETSPLTLSKIPKLVMQKGCIQPKSEELLLKPPFLKFSGVEAIQLIYTYVVVNSNFESYVYCDCFIILFSKNIWECLANQTIQTINLYHILIQCIETYSILHAFTYQSTLRLSLKHWQQQ